MSSTPANIKKAARMQTLVCGFLFSAFSFVYLYVFQCDVLEALHYSLAHGKTSFAPLASAVTLTLIFLLLRWGVNSLLGLKGPVRALAYFPSCLLLAALTDTGRALCTSEHAIPWAWVLPVVLLAYILLVYVLRRIFRQELDRDCSPMVILNGNLLILLLLCLMTVCLGNTDRLSHHELEAGRLMRHREYSEVLQVGRKSDETSRTLSAFRAMALAHTGEMGEKLFCFPQPYRAEGLFFTDDVPQILRYTNDSVYTLLGIRPVQGMDRTGTLRTACYAGTGTSVALDYYLCALLLDKRLEEFARTLPDFYDPDDPLPLHYREAALIYREAHPGYPLAAGDSLTKNRYRDYKQASHRSASGGPELMQAWKDYGNTYWWYFDFQ